MVEKRPIDKLKIKGFKTLQDVELELGKLNVLIGPNGGGKSNLVSYFQMLREMAEQRLQVWIGKRGGADRVLSFGSKRTSQLSSEIRIGESFYNFELEHTDDDRFVFGEEHSIVRVDGERKFEAKSSAGHSESFILSSDTVRSNNPDARGFYGSIANVGIYHFHDTSANAPLKLIGSLQDYRYFRYDASNLAAYLYMLKHFHANTYEKVITTIKLALPFLQDFVLHPVEIGPDEYTIQLMWQQSDSDYPFLASQLSDGSLRFICIVTALLQPGPPSTIIIDEPELGLHPYAITLLGSLLHAASERAQIIVVTQSVSLVNQFAINELIVVEREYDASVFRRLDQKDFALWLEDYTVGELWEKNVLGGRLS